MENEALLKGIATAKEIAWFRHSLFLIFTSYSTCKIGWIYTKYKNKTELIGFKNNCALGGPMRKGCVCVCVCDGEKFQQRKDMKNNLGEIQLDI
jgi:hypothetical protein